MIMRHSIPPTLWLAEWNLSSLLFDKAQVKLNNEKRNLFVVKQDNVEGYKNKRRTWHYF